MKLSLNVLGYELGNLHLEFDQEEAPATPAKVVEKGVGIVSDWWLKRLFRR